MLQPMLFLGLGGAGGKTIRSIIQALERELLSVGYASGIPDSWQFLHIDVVRDGISFPAPMLREDRFLSIVPTGIKYADLVTRMTHLGDGNEQQRMFAGWAIPASPINIGMGAGQVRAIGRLAGLASADAIRSGIAQKISTMNSPQALNQLAELSKAMNLGLPNTNPKAFIFTSLTGGTGSGIYRDVKEILSSAAYSTWVSTPTSFLYNAEVFESLGEGYNHLSSNVLGAINELVSDKFNSCSPATGLLYNKLGLPTSDTLNVRGHSRGTEFLIGSRTNSGHDISFGPTYSGMDQVFKGIGESIASLLTKDELTEWLERISNISTYSKFACDVSGLAPNVQNSWGIGGFSGIGFCKITVGTDHLLNYVADALTREQVRILLWPDLDSQLKEGDPTRETLVENQATDTFKFFLPSDDDGELGFNEHFRNCMISQSIKQQIAESCRGFMLKKLTDKPVKVLKFSQSISLSFMKEERELLEKRKWEVSTNAANWIAETQDSLLAKIAQRLATFGFASVIGALQELIKTIDNEYLPFTSQEESDFKLALTHMRPEDLQRRIVEISGGLLEISKSNSAILTETEKSIRRALQMQVEHFVLSLCADVLSDLSENFLKPILASLTDSHFELQSSIKAEHFSSWGTRRFSVFPEWGSLKVPGEYQPDATEKTLIDPADYEQLYEDYSDHPNDGSAAFIQSIQAALLGADLVQGLSSGTYQGLIQGERWVSGVRYAQIDFTQVARKASFKFQTDLFSLEQRNRRWLQERNSSFGNLLAMGISEYVDEKGIDPSVSQRRTNDFLTLFQQLTYLSSPLMRINSQALSNIATSDSHSLDVPHLQFSKIPFDRGSLVGSTCLGILGSFGVDILNSGVVNSLFDSQSKTRSLMALSVTRGNLPHWAISSFTDPTLRKIAVSRASAASWLNFWDGRRALPLLDSIPLEREIRRSIITGWFISALFGMRKIEVGPVGRSARILNPYSSPETWASLPSPLLENGVADFSHTNWLLPGILSSVSIALSEFGKTGNFEEIEAYLILKHLGREITANLGNRDSWDMPGFGDQLPNTSPQMSKFISRWVREGELPMTACKLLPLLQQKIDSGLSNQSALIEVVSNLQSEYSSNWLEYKEAAWFKMPQTWEMREDLELAFNDICNYVRNL